MILRPSAVFGLLMIVGGALPAVATASSVHASASRSTIPGPATAEYKTWRAAVLASHMASRGCFEADYPSKNWKEVSCGTPRERPQIIPREKQIVRPLDESTSGDYTMTSTAAIASASGSLRSIENVTSVLGFGSTNTNGCQPGQATCPVPNEFNLQLNTEATLPGAAICKGSANPNCTGWMQFVYDSGGSINIQSWAINFGNPPCPSNFNLPPGPRQSCGQKTASFTLPFQPLLKLPDLAGAVLTGDVFKDNAGLIVDEVALEVRGKIYAAHGTDIVGALGNWKTTQFNVYGNSGLDKSIFNSGSLVSVAVNVNNDAGGTVTCSQLKAGDTTGESTNLTVMPCAATNTPAPSNLHGIAFNEGVVPVISSVSPPGGPRGGGTLVTITASTSQASTNNTFVVNGFNPNAVIKFGNNGATAVSCTTSTTSSTCNVRSPAASGGGNVSVGVTAANVFQNGVAGPTSAAVPFQYFVVGPPPVYTTCQPCYDSNRQCIKVTGGYECQGLPQ